MDDRRGDAVSPEEQRNSGAARLGGLLLLVPMAILWIVSLVIPTIRTVRYSTQKVRLGGRAVGVGIANYRQLFGSAPFGQASGFTALLTIERVAVVALLPLLLALSVGAFGRRVRLPLRLIFTLPLAFFAPVGGALAWALAYSRPSGPLSGGGNILGSPGSARLALLRMDALTTLALACGIGLIVYLSARVGAARALAWAVR